VLAKFLSGYEMEAMLGIAAYPFPELYMS
jgi:hypothetical protein